MHAEVAIHSESVTYDRCTGTVKRKVTKVNCSDNEGNFFGIIQLWPHPEFDFAY